MISRKWMLAASSFFIALGTYLLILVIGIYLYGRYEVWAAAQPRTLISSQVIWPDVPPLTPLPSPTPLPTPVPTPTPTPVPPAHIEIPALGVERSIIPVGTVTHGDEVVWDAEKLFARAGQRDLVGHLDGSVNPDQVGNTILIGHNYNQGIYDWRGVFYDLHLLQGGDIIKLTNENDESYLYEVEQVEKVDWSEWSSANLLTHVAYLSPSQDERLTLVTCGGANFAPFPSRLYVVARRISFEE